MNPLSAEPYCGCDPILLRQYYFKPLRLCYEHYTRWGNTHFPLYPSYAFLKVILQPGALANPASFSPTTTPPVRPGAFAPLRSTTSTRRQGDATSSGPRGHAGRGRWEIVRQKNRYNAITNTACNNNNSNKIAAAAAALSTTARIVAVAATTARIVAVAAATTAAETIATIEAPETIATK